MVFLGFFWVFKFFFKKTYTLLYTFRAYPPHLSPLDEVRVLDAVRGRAWRLRQRAEGVGDLGREEPERAVEAGSDTWQDDAGVALEPLRAAVHHGLDAALLQAAV